MASRKLEVQIIGDSSSLERAFGKAGHAGNSFGSAIGKVAKAAALGTAALGAGMAAGIGIGIKSLMEHEKADARLANVLKTTGNAANTNVKAIADLANQMEKKSGIDDVLIKSGAGLLLTFKNIKNSAGEGNDMFNQSVKISNDLSVALGKDLQSSALMVGKALNDPIKGLTALGRAGVQFTEGQKEQIKAMVESGNVMGAQKLIMGELTSQVGGAAEALGGTLAGRLNILKARLEEVAESVAARVLPIFERLVAWVEGNWPTIQSVVETVFAAVGSAITHVWGVISPIFNALVSWVRGFVDNDLPSLRSQGQSVFSSISDFIATAWQAIQPIFNAIRDIITNVVIPVLRELWDIARTAFDGIARVLKEHEPEVRRIMEVIGTVVRALGTIIREVFQNIIAPLLKLVFGEILPTMIGIAITAIDKIISVVKTVGEAFVRGFEAVKRIPIMVTDAFQSAVRAVTGFIGRLLGAGRDAGDGIVRGVTGGLGDLVAKVRGVFQDLWGWITGAAASARAFAANIGHAIVDGIKGGLGAAWEGLKNYASGKLNELKGKLTFWGSGPDEWARKAIGLPIARGISEGFTRGMPGAEDDMLVQFTHLKQTFRTAISSLTSADNRKHFEDELRIMFRGEQMAVHIDELVKVTKEGGAKIVRGLADGARGAASEVHAAVGGLGSSVGSLLTQGLAASIAAGKSVVVTEAQQLVRDSMAAAREVLTTAKTALHDIVKADDFLTPAQTARAKTLFREIGIALRDKSITDEDLEAIRAKLDRLGTMAGEATEKMAAAIESKRDKIVGAYDHLTSLVLTGFQRLGDEQIKIQETTTQRSIDEYTRSLGARTDLTEEARSDMIRIFEDQARATLAIWTRNYQDIRAEQEHHLGLAITTLQTKLQEGQISAGKFQTELKKIMGAAGVDTKTQAEIMGIALSGNIDRAVKAVLQAMGGFASGTKTHFDKAQGHASGSLKRIGDDASTARRHLADMSEYESQASAALNRIRSIAQSVTTGGQLPTQYQAPGGEQPAGTAPAGSQLQTLLGLNDGNAAYYRSISQTQRTAILRSMGLQHGVKSWKGGWAMVGEKGKELVNLPKGSDVYSSPQTTAMLAPQNGGGSQELTIRIPVTLDGRQLTEVVYQGLLDRSRSSGSLFSASPGVRL